MAGIVPGGDLIAVGAKAAAGGILGDIAAKIGVGATYGGLTSAIKNPTNPVAIAEGAAIGGGLFGAGPVVGKLAGGIGSKVADAAAAGRFADITGQDVSITQKAAMRLTGSVTPAPPVGGAGTVKVLEIGPNGEPYGLPPGAKVTGKGLDTTAPEPTQPPRDISNFLQEFEGSTPPTRTGMFEGEPFPPPPVRSTPAPAQPTPYSGTPGTPWKVDFTEPAPSPATVGGRPLFGGEYGIKPIDQAAPVKGGPSGAGAGPGYQGGSGGASGAYDFQFDRTPSGSQFDAAGRFRQTFDQPSAKPAADVGFSWATLPGLGSTPVPPRPKPKGLGSTALLIQNIGQALQVEPGLSHDPFQTPSQTLIPSQVPTQIPTQTTVTKQVPKTPTPPGEPSPTTLFSDFTPPRGFGLSGLSSGAAGAERAGPSRKRFLFGEKKNPINILFGGGSLFGKANKRKGKKKG